MQDAQCTAKVNSLYPHKFDHNATVAADPQIKAGHDTCGMTEAEHAHYTPERIRDTNWYQARYDRAVTNTRGHLNGDCFAQAQQELIDEAHGEALAEDARRTREHQNTIIVTRLNELALCGKDLRGWPYGECTEPAGHDGAHDRRQAGPRARPAERCDIAREANDGPHGGQVRPYRSVTTWARWMICDRHAPSAGKRVRISPVDVAADHDEARQIDFLIRKREDDNRPGPLLCLRAGDHWPHMTAASPDCRTLPTDQQ